MVVPCSAQVGFLSRVRYDSEYVCIIMSDYGLITRNRGAILARLTFISLPTAPHLFLSSRHYYLLPMCTKTCLVGHAYHSPKGSAGSKN